MNPEGWFALLYGVVLLSRTIRFAAFGASPGEVSASEAAREDVNGFGGRPSLAGMDGHGGLEQAAGAGESVGGSVGGSGGWGRGWSGWGSHLELVVVCVGEPDPATGYLINIKAIDAGVRRGVLPLIERAIGEGRAPMGAMPELFAAASASVEAPVRALTLRMSPTYAIEMEAGMGRVVTIRQRFEFAAAHRLHAATLSDEENRRFFGKCNNPAGHGHNYVVEPQVLVEVRNDGASFGLRDLERITMATVIDPFDHKHLNVDTPEFRDGEGLNPTVENIARVFYGLLSEAIAKDGRGASGASGGSGGTLKCVTVWETDRTSATYPG